MLLTDFGKYGICSNLCQYGWHSDRFVLKWLFNLITIYWA